MKLTFDELPERVTTARGQFHSCRKEKYFYKITVSLCYYHLAQSRKRLVRPYSNVISEARVSLRSNDRHIRSPTRETESCTSYQKCS